MRNLLLGYDLESFMVVTAENARGSDQDVPADFRTHHLLRSSSRLPSRINRSWRAWQKKRLTDRLVKVVERNRPVAMVGVYPDFHFVNAAREAALATNTPWVLYAHDTIAESLQHTSLADRAARLQEAAFDEASEILVMSKGMAELFEQKYGVESRPLEHVYTGKSHDPPEGDPPRSLFWGGQVYNINDAAVRRISRAASQVDCTLTVTTSQSGAQLSAAGLAGSDVNATFYPDPNEYLSALRSHGILVLALNAPDESQVHKDELSTIFPTKTPEYLASGRPILVHCPGDYFLARFFRHWECGLVVSDRSEDALKTGIEYLLTTADARRAYARAAREALKLFSPEGARRTMSEALVRAVAKRR